MELQLTESDFLPGWSLKGTLDLNSGEAVLVYGSNGVGKSSLLQYFKLRQKTLFPGKTLRFIDQPRLTPLNEISFNEILEQFSEVENRSKDKNLFSEFYPVVESYADLPLKDLSGGQNQMCKILLGIFLGGDIFFFDEPSQSLDDENVKNFACMLEGLKSRDKACLIIEHQSGLVKSLCQRTYKMDRRDHEIYLEMQSGN